MEIRKKTYSKQFEQVLAGKKNFDLRLADFECGEGDVLVLEEINSKREKTGRVLKKKINYVIKTKDLPWFKKEDIDKYGYQVIGF